ncbi:hypothetical protein BJ166DRAFT_69675 [Pestalotiopsis sp. NC0098]|nr:hypothetical protein BJ166DRAFT_69675 [Pestalotiopsis sp. NC0098]
MLLPQNIWDSIFGHLEWQADTFDVSVEDHRINRQTLASLCRVCKHSRKTATPLLYTQVRLFEGDVQFFARTILGDLNTRRLVEGLSLEFGLKSYGSRTVGSHSLPTVDQDLWYYRRCLAEALRLARGGKNPSAAGVGGADILAAQGTDFDGRQEDLAGVLLFVLPRLRYLRIKLGPTADPFYHESRGVWRSSLILQVLRLPFRARRGSSQWRPKSGPDPCGEDIQLLTPASLFHLRELVLCSPCEKPLEYRETVRYDLDPQAIFAPIEEMQPFWGLPSLKSLTLERAAWRAYSAPMRCDVTSSVEYLCLLDTAILPEESPRLLKHFPLLRAITYAPADYSHSLDPNHKVLNRDELDEKEIGNVIRFCSEKVETITIKIGHRPALGIDTSIRQPKQNLGRLLTTPRGCGKVPLAQRSQSQVGARQATTIGASDYTRTVRH